MYHKSYCLMEYTECCITVFDEGRVVTTKGCLRGRRYYYPCVTAEAIEACRVQASYRRTQK